MQRMIVIEPPPRMVKEIAKKHNSSTNYKRTATSTSSTSLQRAKEIAKKH